MKSAPCKGCLKHEIGCHGTCKEYLEYRAYRDNLLKRKQQELEIQCYTIELRKKIYTSKRLKKQSPMKKHKRGDKVIDERYT